MHKQRQVIDTADGSHTVRLHEGEESFHSINGAWTESMHVFIEQGFRRVSTSIDPVSVLEVGFGTGLNAFITWLEVRESTRKVHYVGLEPHPVGKPVWAILNYPDFAGDEKSYGLFRDMHLAPWGTPVFLDEGFILNKLEELVESVVLRQGSFDLVYFDAFSFDTAPDIWSEEIFRKMFDALKNGGILVTYAAKGEVRRRLSRAGFEVEKIPGPPGKREMLRAVRNAG